MSDRRLRPGTELTRRPGFPPPRRATSRAPLLSPVRSQQLHGASSLHKHRPRPASFGRFSSSRVGANMRAPPRPTASVSGRVSTEHPVKLRSISSGAVVMSLRHDFTSRTMEAPSVDRVVPACPSSAPGRARPRSTHGEHRTDHRRVRERGHKPLSSRHGMSSTPAPPRHRITKCTGRASTDGVRLPATFREGKPSSSPKSSSRRSGTTVGVRPSAGGRGGRRDGPAGRVRATGCRGEQPGEGVSVWATHAAREPDVGEPPSNAACTGRVARRLHGTARVGPPAPARSGSDELDRRPPRR